MHFIKDLDHPLEVAMGVLKKELQAVKDRLPKCYDTATRLYCAEEAHLLQWAVDILQDKVSADIATDPESCKPEWVKRYPLAPTTTNRT